MQNEPQLSAELRSIAKYLGCNEGEFISEVSKLLATALEEQKQEIVEKYGDYRFVVKKRFGYEIGRTLRFFLLPHTQHKKGDDENL